MTTPTQAQRPRAVDTDAIRVLWSEYPQVMALAADLDATRAERDAARAALPDAGVARSIAVVLDMNGLSYTADILHCWAERIDDANAGNVSAPVPVMVPDVPDFVRRAIDRRAALAGGR